MDTTVNNQRQDTIVSNTRNNFIDTMSNAVSSTSSNNVVAGETANHVSRFNDYYNAKYINSGGENDRNGTTVNNVERKHPRSQCKSVDNINNRNYMSPIDNTVDNGRNVNRRLSRVQNSLSNIDLSLQSHELQRYESLQIPIVGYEVMEERARFTIFKLKVEDEKSNQSWLVFRRYTDFVRLYSRIKTENPSLMLPLPGKRWFRDNFEPAFLEDRVRGLQIFVNAIVKRLPNHPLVREYFCLDEPPQVFSYQPEAQAVYGALEDSIGALKMQVKHKDATIQSLQKRISQLESLTANCHNCSTKGNANT